MLACSGVCSYLLQLEALHRVRGPAGRDKQGQSWRIVAPGDRGMHDARVD